MEEKVLELLSLPCSLSSISGPTWSQGRVSSDQAVSERPFLAREVSGYCSTLSFRLLHHQMSSKTAVSLVAFPRQVKDISLQSVGRTVQTILRSRRTGLMICRNGRNKIEDEGIRSHLRCFEVGFQHLW